MFCPRYTIGRGVFCQPSKKRGGFRPPITKWTWGVLSVGCFVLHSDEHAFPPSGFAVAWLGCSSVSPSHFYYGAAPCPFSPAPCPFSQRHVHFLNLHSVPYILVKSLSKNKEVTRLFACSLQKKKWQNL